MLLDLTHPTSCWHEKFPRKPQATNVASTWQNAHQIDITVNKYWWDWGKASRKIAESTGKLPPTPKLQKAANTPIAAKVGEPAAIRPQTPLNKKVRLNANFLPITSLEKDRNAAPANSPTIYRVKKKMHCSFHKDTYNFEPTLNKVLYLVGDEAHTSPAWRLS